MANKLSKTGIEYARGDDGKPGYGWNFYPGCLHKQQGKCPIDGCWAEGMWKRQCGVASKKGITLPDFHHPHLIPERLLAPFSVKKPSRILVNFMGDLFGDWVDPQMQIKPDIETNIPFMVSLSSYVAWIIRQCPQHTFIFLTKQPQNLAKWSPFPPNCHVGVSATDWGMFFNAAWELQDVKASVKFISLEPLLGEVAHREFEGWLRKAGISWLVIGQQTPVKASTMPRIEWISEIVKAADQAHVKVFLKNNLNCCAISDYPELLDKNGNLRQEYPVRS